MHYKRGVITTLHNFGPLFVTKKNRMKKKREERDEHMDLNEEMRKNGHEIVRMKERQTERKRERNIGLCVLAYPLTLVFTWLLIHYTEHST